jgi:NADH-quinone oxidoreductase subunit A
MFDLSTGGMIFAFWSMMVFLGVLAIGFIYEWKKGALEWQ